jgi:hypothetical protein
MNKKLAKYEWLDYTGESTNPRCIEIGKYA